MNRIRLEQILDQIADVHINLSCIERAIEQMMQDGPQPAQPEPRPGRNFDEMQQAGELDG